jgi:4-hydroxy-3-methylbut-2-enyl diphosphate reductase
VRAPAEVARDDHQRFRFAPCPPPKGLLRCKLLIAAPRGFCAGCRPRDRDRRARDSTSSAQPVFVRHEIVHNRYVVDGLKAKGAIFVEELDEVPMVRRWSSRRTACPR